MEAARLNDFVASMDSLANLSIVGKEANEAWVVAIHLSSLITIRCMALQNIGSKAVVMGDIVGGANHHEGVFDISPHEKLRVILYVAASRNVRRPSMSRSVA